MFDYSHFFTITQLFFMITMMTAMYGSKLFVDEKFLLGAKWFLVGNAMNLALGLAIGNIFFTIAQLGLGVFTVPMLDVKKEVKFFAFFVLLFVSTLIINGVNDVMAFHFLGPIDLIAAVTAWIGAYYMWKGNMINMSIAWIVADLGFLYIAFTNGIVGLGIMATVFIYHGVLRLRKILLNSSLT